MPVCLCVPPLHYICIILPVWEVNYISDGNSISQRLHNRVCLHSPKLLLIMLLKGSDRNVHELFLRSLFVFQAFSVFFVCVTFTSDIICLLFIPMQWLFFAASTYVWVQYVWHTGTYHYIYNIYIIYILNL